MSQTLALDRGFTEVYNYSFVSPVWLERVGLDPAQHLELDNPVAKDRPYIRRHLWPNMLQNVEMNLHRFDAIQIFEIGRTYLGEEKGEALKKGSEERLPKQDTCLGLAYAEKGNDMPWYTLAESLRRAIARAGCVLEFRPATPTLPIFHAGRMPSAWSWTTGWVCR